MGLVYSRSQSGLVVAEQGGDEAAIARALKEYDPDLRLLPPGVDLNGTDRRHYRVVAYRGGDRPPRAVCAWATDSGEPLPLSSRLLDKVKLLDRNTRTPYPTADEQNERLREQRERYDEEYDEDMVDWFVRRDKVRSPVRRSVGLRMSRDRMRARGKKA